jgi:16S rRNA (guanine966-N2)-methyltransferase
MRVVAGSAKGRRLAPVPPGTRPLSDRAREGLFSSLGEAVVDTRVLDLYAGTGANGIEALSRGAREAVFVEKSPPAIRALRVNLQRTGLEERGTILRRDVLRFLATAPPDPFELIFLDPPWATPPGELDGLVAGLDAGWLSAGWTVVLHRPSQGYMPVIPVNWHVAKRLGYGDSLLALYREV